MGTGRSAICKPLFYIVFLTVLVAAFPLHASEKLDFDQKLNERTQRLVEGFAQEQIKSDITDLRIARADLNEDGLSEFILTSKACENSPGLCDYTILAEMKDSIVEIGAFRARTVLLGNGYSGGIRNIMAFDKEINDYDYELYVWEPLQSRYILAE